MKSLLKLTMMALLCQACSNCHEPSKSNNQHLTYQNIIILSDLSDRKLKVDFPNKDIAEINKIIKHFETECVKPGEKIGDRSSIYFSTFSDKNLTFINLDDIRALGEKQSFINSTGKHTKNGLKQRLINFQNTVKSKYATTLDLGLDLLSILIEKISNENIIKKDKIITNGTDSTFIHYQNQVYIFTDGYLEYNIKSKNNQFRFGLPEIKKARLNCIDNNLSIENVIDKNSNLSLRPVKREIHNLVNLHIMETHERDYHNNTHSYDNPIGLRDNEILEAVWKKWSTESGFKSIEWNKY